MHNTRHSERSTCDDPNVSITTVNADKRSLTGHDRNRVSMMRPRLPIFMPCFWQSGMTRGGQILTKAAKIPSSLVVSARSHPTA